MSQSSSDRGEEPRIEPTAFSPPATGERSRRFYLRPLPLAVAALFLMLLAAAWFVLTAEGVTLRFQPPPDRVAVAGGLSVPIGGHRLMRPGRYTVVAEKAGYQRLRQPIEVTADGDDVFAFELTKLPGRLRVTSQPPGARVFVDGEQAGSTPLEPVKLAPGKHRIELRAQRYQVYRRDVTIEGEDKLQAIAAELTPAWAPVTFSSEPSGATIHVDGEARGTTPASVEIGAGSHEVSLTLDGYRTWRRELTVEADQPQTLDTVTLAEARGKLRVTSQPAGANVAMAGSFAGHTPVTLELPPGQAQSIRIAKAGYQPVSRQATVASGGEESMAVELKPIMGTVSVHATPAGATVYVDGQARGPAEQKLSLLAVPHDIEIRKSGYADYKTTVTPKPGLTQEIAAQLLTNEEAKYAALPNVIETGGGQRLRLIKPGSFTMGAPRREQGRRANEAEREVKLTRAYYLGVHEVTNAEFRRFRSGHSSGIVARTTLDNDNYPVVRVSWEDAVAYCNWLSRQDGLEPAYRGGELVTPVTTGYRLPTEAEWAWAARFAGGRHLKYPWGASMPPTGRAGNYADASAAGLVQEHLESYDDGYKAAAPVGRFAANALGLYDMGGNVAEWMHDAYSGGVQIVTTTQVDPRGDGSGPAHAVRGSSWRDGRITELRLSYRGSSTGPRDDLGFRIARYAE